jgi:streptothricin acetyltransferase
MDARVIARPVRPEDIPALVKLDLRYDASAMLAISREEIADAYTFSLRWIERTSATELYNTYDDERLRRAMSRVDLFLVAEVEGAPVGLLMVVLPKWTDAGEITDLAVDARARRCGAGRALVDVAVEFARTRGLRALWVEPRSDNAAAIEFYRALGFRLSGFNDRMYSNADDAPGRTTLFMHLEVRR